MERFISQTLKRILKSTFSIDKNISNPSSTLFAVKEWEGYSRFEAFFCSSVYRLLHSEYKRLHLSEVVNELSKMEGRVLEMAESCKAKDFHRGLHVDTVLNALRITIELRNYPFLRKRYEGY